MSSSSVLAAVLAGGRSRRYGSDKSAARVGAVPMVQRVLRTARQVAQDTVLVSSRPVAGAETEPRIPDRMAGKGPLAGLHAALHEARRRGMEAVLLLPCDMPLVPEVLLQALVDARGPAPAVAPRGGGGRVQVLCAVYSVEILDLVERRLREDDHSLQALFREVGGRALDLAELGVADADHHLLNVNTPEERDRAHRVAGSGPAGEDGS